MLLLYLLPFTCQALVATARTLPTVYQFSWPDQTLISMAAELKKVPGHNNATFCPGVEQLFKVEFLEIAPDPVPVSVACGTHAVCPLSIDTITISNRIFFVYLRGAIAAEAVGADALSKVKVRITSEAALDSGESQEPRTYEIPLKTTSFGQNAHLSVRNATGISDFLTPGQNDILTDCWIPGMFLQTGLWSFKVEGVLEDGRHLFCMSLKQRLEHGNT